MKRRGGPREPRSCPPSPRTLGRPRSAMLVCSDEDRAKRTGRLGPGSDSMSWISRYARWLHTRWPAGRVEKLPRSAPDGSTGVPGVYLCGDLTGVPLLKFALDSGARAVETIQRRLAAERPGA